MGKYTAWKMKAAICDDTVEDAEFMEKHIKEYFMKKSIPYECNVYQSSKALWYEIEDGQAFDLLFLDIEMPDATRCKVRSSLKKISEKLPEDEFVWVDRGYLCNLYHVKQIKDNQMVLSTGQQLYIGERRLAQLKHRIMEYWQTGTDNGKWSTND